jgi:hypothetical protein
MQLGLFSDFICRVKKTIDSFASLKQDGKHGIPGKLQMRKGPGTVRK